MRIVFVRHGHPDYKTDSLIEIGKIQAEAAAKRLEGERISEIYASTMGRAMQTAEPFSQKSGIPVIPLDFMREVTWGVEDTARQIPHNGHPWLLLPEYVKAGESLSVYDWENYRDFAFNTKLHKSVARVTAGADAWLRELGYVREGEYYRVSEGAGDKTVVIFSHGGSSTAFISHLLNLPFLSACLFVRPYFCSVSVIRLEGKVGELVMPTIEILGDSRHVPRSVDDATIDN